ncbi:hypothetical protein [Alistipes indistinctus]|uniref:hypothetical protein n=1 Tax=Alistipes indistinctus TaxID=626932 RepID=UPI0036F1B5E6
MKSKRAEEFINNSSELIDGLEWMIDTSTARRAVELAEGDAEEEIEALKAIAVEAFKEYMKQEHGGFLSSDLDNFIQKLNER